MITNIAGRIAAVGILIILGGCVSTSRHPYPTQWPAIRAPSGSDCREIAGVFRNERPAESVPPEFSRPLVVWISGRYSGASRSNFSEVQIAPAGAARTFFARRSATEPWEALPTREWKCVEGRLVAPPLEPVNGEGHATWHMGGSVELSIDADGALIVHVLQSDTYQSMVFLFNEKQEAWLRYASGGQQAR